jgi:hypothetical protein
MITNHLLQNGPVQRFVSGGCLAVDANRLLACRALAEDVDRVRVRIDDGGYPGAHFGEQGGFQGAYEHAALDAIAVGLQDGGYPCPARSSLMS